MTQVAMVVNGGSLASASSVAPAVSDATRLGLLVDDCSDVTPWNIQATGTGTITAVTSDPLEPRQFVLATTAQTNYQIGRDVGVSIPEGGALVLRVKPDANLQQLNVVLFTGSHAAQKVWTPQMGVTAMFAGEWYQLVIAPEYIASVFGVPTGGSPASMQRLSSIALRVYAKAGQDTSLAVAGIRVVGSDTTPRIAWTFDDGRDDTYTVAYPILAAAGYTGAIAVEYTAVGSGGRCTLAQLQTMYAAGWSIYGHHATDLTTLSTADATTALRGAKDWMLDNGFTRGSSHWAWPGGGKTLALDKIARTIYKTRRGTATMTSAGVNRAYDPTDPPHIYIVKTTTLAAMETRFANLASYGGQNRITFHSIVASPSATEDWAITDFQSLVTYAAAQGIGNLSLDDLYGTLDPAGR